MAVSLLLLASGFLVGSRLTFVPAPWPPSSAGLIALSMVSLTTIAVVGLLLVGGRWARRLGLVVTAAGGLVLVAAPSGWTWWLALPCLAGAAVGLAGPWIDTQVRQRPAAAGPPAPAVLIPLLLVATPGLMGAASLRPAGAAEWLIALICMATALWYARGGRGVMLGMRLLLPIAVVLSAVASGLPTGLAILAAGGTVVGLAWRHESRLAVRPLLERGRAVRIPPELAPPEILDAAGLDTRGRPKRE